MFSGPSNLETGAMFSGPSNLETGAMISDSLRFSLRHVELDLLT